MFSVVILTLNEERALPACLDSLRGIDDVVVLDSGSTDRTADIAKAWGARVFVRPFDSFVGQRNYAQRSIAFRNAWVLHLDADERMTAAAVDECRRAAERSDLDGFRLAPKMIFEGQWIPHCTDYPAFQARLVRAPQFEFIQVGHGQREAPAMRLDNLREGYLHDLSVYGTDAWLKKHRRYAKDEARAWQQGSQEPQFRGLLSSDALTRRRALKRISLGLPFRPALRFIYQYILKRGFLDGRGGLRYCRLLAQYEGFVAMEINKLKNPG